MKIMSMKIWFKIFTSVIITLISIFYCFLLKGAFLSVKLAEKQFQSLIVSDVIRISLLMVSCLVLFKVVGLINILWMKE